MSLLNILNIKKPNLHSFLNGLKFNVNMHPINNIEKDIFGIENKDVQKTIAMWDDFIDEYEVNYLPTVIGFHVETALTIDWFVKKKVALNSEKALILKKAFESSFLELQRYMKMSNENWALSVISDVLRVYEKDLEKAHSNVIKRIEYYSGVKPEDVKFTKKNVDSFLFESIGTILCSSGESDRAIQKVVKRLKIKTQ